jgi:hypothetical protein
VFSVVSIQLKIIKKYNNIILFIVNPAPKRTHELCKDPFRRELEKACRGSGRKPTALLPEIGKGLWELVVKARGNPGQDLDSIFQEQTPLEDTEQLFVDLEEMEEEEVAANRTLGARTPIRYNHLLN